MEQLGNGCLSDPQTEPLLEVPACTSWKLVAPLGLILSTYSIESILTHNPLDIFEEDNSIVWAHREDFLIQKKKKKKKRRKKTIP